MSHTGWQTNSLCQQVTDRSGEPLCQHRKRTARRRLCMHTVQHLSSRAQVHSSVRPQASGNDPSEEHAQSVPRLQRMLLQLQKYDMKIEYKPGSEMLLADALSRCSAKYSQEIKLDLHVDYIAFTSAWIETLKETTCEDPVLSTVYQLVQHRWPKERRRVPNVAKYYWDFRDELSTDEGLLLKGPSLIIPAALRENYLQRLQEGHLSASKMITNARQHMFWPGIEADIKDYTRRCQVCIKRSRPAREPLQPHEIPDGPWQKLGMDFFDLKGKCYILICDYFLKFPFMFSCKTSWGSLKDRLIDLFSNEGFPKEIISDNSALSTARSLQTISPATVSNILHHHPTIPRVMAS